jgi:hypothetical protein
VTTLVQPNDRPIKLVVMSAGVSDPSSTRLLADRIAQKSLDRLSALGFATSLDVIDLAPLAVDIAKAMTAGFSGEKVQAAIDVLARADAAIADAVWNGYQHQFGGSVTQGQRKAEDVNLDSDMMRLAAGGSLSPEVAAN